MEKYVDKNGLLHALQGVKTQLEKYRQSVYDTKGTANGIASLDENGNVPLSQLGNVDTVLFEIVQTLPTSIVEKQKSHIFIVPRGSEEGTTNNSYKEYVYVGSDITKVASTDWEELGEFTSEVDLKNYSKKNETVKSIEITAETSDGYSTNSTYQNLKVTLADGTYFVVNMPCAAGPASKSPGNDGYMSSSDKAKLDKIDTDALDAAINNANTAADNANIKATGAEKVNATLSDDYVFAVTDRNGSTKTLALDNIIDYGKRTVVLEEEVASIQHQIEVSNAFVGFTRENGAVSPDAKSTYGSKSLIHEIGKHFRMATVKNGKIQHYLVGGRITKAVNGDDVAIDGTDGDVLLVCDTNINLLKATCDVDGIETNCLGLGLSPCYWHDKASKQLPKFGISPVDTVNCKLDDDYRSCAHSIYNTDMAGSHSAPQGLFVKSYKTDGKGYSSQYISAIESIKQAQNKNEDALTNRPYIGLYYEFYEALIALMFTEIGSVNAGSNTSFGIGVTCSEQPTASTFVGDQLYANSGFQITLADGTNVYYNAMPNKAVTIGGVSKGNWWLNNSISSESYSQIQVLEGQRVLDGIAKNGWESKMNTNDNIFYFGEDGNLCLTTSTDVNLSTGEGMTECTRYYVARDVPNCEGMSDGVMTAVVNIYTKMTFVDSCTFDSKDVSNCTCIAKQSVPVYRGFALPLTGHFRQLYGMNLVYEVSTENVLTEKFKFAENVQDIPALTVFNNTAYEAALGTDTPMEKGLTQEYTLPFTNSQAWVSKDNYSLSLFAATECKSASRATKESRYFWYNGGNAGAGKKQVHASVVGCHSGYVAASVRSLAAHHHAGYGYACYAGAFAVLFED